jgi:WXG100 family type VII secretion target
MPNDRTRYDYESLQLIAALFAKESASCDDMLQKLRRYSVTLEQGWVGLAGQAFQAEMLSVVLPSLERLTRALDGASATTRQIGQAGKSAEAAAAIVLSGRNVGAVLSSSGAIGAGTISAPAALSALTGFWPQGMNPFAPIQIDAGRFYELLKSPWKNGNNPFAPITLGPDVIKEFSKGLKYKFGFNPVTKEFEASVEYTLPSLFNIEIEHQGLLKNMGIDPPDFVKVAIQDQLSILPGGSIIANQLLGGRMKLDLGNGSISAGGKVNVVERSGDVFVKGSTSGMTIGTETVTGDTNLGRTSTSEVKILSADVGVGYAKSTKTSKGGRFVEIDASAVTYKQEEGVNINGKNIAVGGEFGVGVANTNRITDEGLKVTKSVLVGPIPVKVGVHGTYGDAIKPIELNGDRSVIKIKAPGLKKDLPGIANEDNEVVIRDGVLQRN